MEAVGRLSRLERLAARASFALAMIGLAMLLVIALATLASILSRWLLNEPLAGLRDFIRLSIPIVVAASFPSGLLRRQNIAIRFLGRRLGGRANEFLDLLGALALLFVFCALAWQFIAYARYLGETGEYSWILELPLAPWWAATSVLIALCVPIQLIVVLVHAGWTLAGQRPQERLADEAEHF